MALFRDDSGRTEPATPQRLQEAAEKGQVPMSRELVTAGSLLVATITLASAGPFVWQRFAEAIAGGLDVRLGEHRLGDADVHGAVDEIRTALAPLLPALAILAVPALCAVLLFGYGQVGFRFRGKALRLDPARLSPLKNLNRLFSAASLIRTLVSLLFLSAVAGILWWTLRDKAPAFLAMLDQDPHDGFAGLFGIAVRSLIWIAVIAMVLALGDVAWQRFDLSQNLRMSKQEVDDERKRTEGDPLVKSRIRQAAQELARQRMMEAVPHADVVITNPTHFAVALAYDRTKHASPEVVAKGTDEVAARIREIAKEHDVPLVEDPPLARALHRATKVGQEIPETFFKAVATVLGQVLRLRGERTAGGAR